MSVVIPTTLGPVSVTGLIELAGEGGRSAMCLEGTTTLIGVASGYNAFVRLTTGVIHRLYGKTPQVDYRLDVSANVDAGSSWQLAVLLAHALYENGRRLETAADAEGPLVWATGAINPAGVTVANVGHVADKLRRSRELFEAALAKGRAIHIFIPIETERDIDPDIAGWLAERGLKPIPLRSADAAFAALGLPPIPRMASPADATTAAFSGNPYRGLQPYQREHRALFFGRTKAREEALEKLRIAAGHGRPFLLVHGQSGVGKSSLVQAGLCADVEERAREGGRFRSVVISPAQGGGDPVSALCRGLRTMLDMPAEPKDGTSYPNDAQEVTALLQKLRDGSASGFGKQSGLLIIDQLEELFEPTAEAPRAVAFGDLVEKVVASGVVWVIATMRADAIGQLDRVPALAHLASAERVYRLDRPSRLELLEIIAAPAALAGKSFPDRNVPESFADIAAASPDSLPLLQSVLYLFFDQADERGQLTAEGLKRIGGFEGAVGRWADRARAEIVQSGISPDLVDRVLVSLVRIEPETRRPLSRSVRYEPGSEEGAVIRQLADARLVSLFDGTDGPRARLAHEVLATHWPHLAGFVERLAAAIILRDDLEERAGMWVASGHENGELLRGAARLDAAQTFLREALVPFETVVADYVAASVAAAQEETRKVQRLADSELERARVERDAATARSRAARNFLRLLAAASVALACFGGIAGWQWSEASSASEAAKTALKQEKISADAAKDAAARAAQSADSAKEAAEKEKNARELAETQAKRADEQTEKAMKAENDALRQLQAARINAARFIALRAEQMKDEDLGLARLALLEILPDSLQGTDLKPLLPEAVSAMTKLNTVKLPRMLHYNLQPIISRRNFSPDWKYMAGVYSPRFASISDTKTGVVFGAIAADVGDLSEIQVSPDGRHLLITMIDVAQLWDLQTGKKVGTYRGHKGPIVGTRFNTKGDKITTVSADGTIRVWDSKDEYELNIFTIEEKDSSGTNLYPIFGNAILTPDETRLIYSSSGSSDRLYAVDTEELLATFEGESGTVDGPVLSRDGKLFVNGRKDKLARIWDTRTGDLLRTLEGHTDAVSGAFFNQDGSKIVTFSEDGSTRLWNAATGEQLSVFPDQGSAVLGAALSPDGQKLATWSTDKILRLWDVNSRSVTERVTGRPTGFSMAIFSPDGNYLATSSPQFPTEIWSLGEKGQLRQLSSITGIYQRTILNHDGTQLLTTTYKQAGGYRLDLLNAADGNVIRTLIETSPGNPEGINSAAFSKDGQRVAVSLWNGKIRIFETGTGRELRPISDLVMTLGKAAFSPDNRRLLTITNFNIGLVRDAETNTTVADLTGHSAPLLSASFSADGRRIVTTANDNTIRIWNAEDGQPIDALPRQAVPALDAIFSPDGQKVLFVSADYSVRIWELNGGSRTRTLAAPGWADLYSGSGQSISFSPDSRQAAILSTDGSVRVFDTQTGAPLEKIELPGKSPVNLTYGTSGLRVVSISPNKVDIFELGTGASQKNLLAREHLLSYRLMSEAERNDLFPESEKPAPPIMPGDMNPCDRLAADPLDMQRPKGPAVEFAALSKLEAVVACTTAAANEPQTIRFKYQLGRAYAAAGQHRDALRVYREAADKGYAVAYDALGIFSQNGWGMPIDLATARQMFEKAVTTGAPSGLLSLASMAQFGLGEPANLAKSKELLEKAAQARLPAAHEAMAIAAERGSPVSPPNMEDALFHTAAAAVLYSDVGDETLAFRNRFRRAALAHFLPTDQVAAVWARVLDWRSRQPAGQ